MKIMQLHLILFWFVAFQSLSQGQTVINGDFASDIAGEDSHMSGSRPDIGGDGSPIDDGWIEARPGDDNWDLGLGTATRGGGKDNPFNLLGIAQIFSNPASVASAKYLGIC